MCRNQSEIKDAVASAAAAAEAAAADDGDDEGEDDDDDDDDDDNWLNNGNNDNYFPRAPYLGPHYCPIEMCDRAMEPLPSRAALVMHFQHRKNFSFLSYFITLSLQTFVPFNIHFASTYRGKTMSKDD